MKLGELLTNTEMLNISVLVRGKHKKSGEKRELCFIFTDSDAGKCVNEALHAAEALNDLTPVHAILFAGDIDHVHHYDGKGFYLKAENYFANAMKLVTPDLTKEVRMEKKDLFTTGSQSADAYYELCGGSVSFGDSNRPAFDHMLQVGYTIAKEQYLLSSREEREMFAAGFQARMSGLIGNTIRPSDRPTVTMRACRAVPS